jgi:murein DD-endopeptidase MepM/ murein hydrolase activator NlpD
MIANENIARRAAWRIAIGAALIALAPPMAAAEPPLLDVPLACRVGADCWVSNHVDVDPGSAARDYLCGEITYDGHSGIDIAVRDLKAMIEGMTVIAAAPGRVASIRDGMDDVSVAQTGREAVAGRECGNGVLIDHGDGWQTQYCHMRKGSLRVRPGDSVARGRELGLVGLSGLSEYPHLHMSVRHKGEVVDAFLGRPRTQCGAELRPLWSAEAQRLLAAARGAIYNMGVLGAEPKSEAAQRGDYRDMRPDARSPAMVVWVEIFQTGPADTVVLELRGPGGVILARREEAIAKRQVRIFRYSGIRLKGERWPPGTYEGTVIYRLAGQETGKARTVAVEIR